MHRWAVLLLFMFVLLNGNEAVVASDKIIVSSLRPNVEWGSFNLSPGGIETAEIKWSCCNKILLTKDEVNKLTIFLSKVTQRDVTIFTGPAPKGGPTRLELSIKPNQRFSLVFNGDYLLYRGSQVYFPELREFTNKIKKRVQSDREQTNLYASLVAPVTRSHEYEEHHKRLVLTLLAPNIQNQINQFYKDRLTTSPQFAPFLGGTELNVLYYSSHMEVNVTLTPYVGPHLDVGMDSIKFHVDNAGKVTVAEYKHVKNYELPPNYKSLILREEER
ncbi:hypothetical protein J2T17_007732 [Paenibacillus mucilaginosus]|uniref:DUF3888 domain-containing protein n=1 Tax=Paenibacillus mucilaginosus TaxID=61624 RepID=UPI003D196E09